MHKETVKSEKLYFGELIVLEHFSEFKMYLFDAS